MLLSVCRSRFDGSRFFFCSKTYSFHCITQYALLFCSLPTPYLHLTTISFPQLPPHLTPSSLVSHTKPTKPCQARPKSSPSIFRSSLPALKQQSSERSPRINCPAHVLAVLASKVNKPYPMGIRRTTPRKEVRQNSEDSPAQDDHGTLAANGGTIPQQDWWLQAVPVCILTTCIVCR